MTHPTDQANAERIDILSKVVEAERWAWKGNTLVASGFSLVVENEQTAKYVAESHNSTLLVMADKAAVEAYCRFRALAPDPVTMKEIEGLVDELVEASKEHGRAHSEQDDSYERYQEAVALSSKAHAALLAKIAPALASQRVPDLAELRNAIAFFDKVKGATEAEKIAVGTNHWDRLEAAARKAISTSPAVADGGWQPITTVPNEGSVLVYVPANKEKGISTVFEALAEPNGDFEDPVYSEWDGKGATYWRPLPAPPQQQPTAPGQDGEGR